jgi:hypothetical protein
MISNKEKSLGKGKEGEVKVKRLPCRGCTVNCSLYKECKGRLWRT